MAKLKIKKGWQKDFGCVWPIWEVRIAEKTLCRCEVEEDAKLIKEALIRANSVEKMTGTKSEW